MHPRSKLASRLATTALRIVLPLSVAGVALGARSAEAEDLTAQAAREFAEGQRAFGVGDFRHAAEQFEAAYKHKPHPAPLYNAARARMRAGDGARAANLYARFLREAPSDARDRGTAAASLRQLSPRLGQLEVHAVGFEDLKVDKEPATEGALYVNPGAHVVEARKGDKAVHESASVDAGQTVSVALVASEGPVPSTPPPSPPPETRKPASPGGWSPVVVVVGSGITIVGAALTVASGVDTLSQKTTFQAAQTQENLDSGRLKQTRTNVALAATLAVGVLTGVAAIWLVDWHENDRAARVGIGLGQVMLRGSF